MSEQKEPENSGQEEAPGARHRSWPASPPPRSWDQFTREATRAAIEEATGHGLSVDDPTPDTLIATAQAEGLQPWELRIWIYDAAPKLDWSGAALSRWAKHYGLGAHAAASEASE
jgi:hypothetical protein